MERRGFIVWFTGMSGAGKSTLSSLLLPVICSQMEGELLDGDEVRNYLSRGLGFSRADRDTNVLRIGFVANLLARHKVAVITAAISPFREARAEVRRLAKTEELAFIEVYVRATLDTLVGRDVKGLYKKALAGEIPHFTGVNDPYEPPDDPEVVVDSSRESVEESLGRVIEVLCKRGLIAPPGVAKLR